MKSLEGAAGGPLTVDANGLAEALLDHQSLGVALIDAAQRVLSWNRWMADWTGIDGDDARGKTLTRLFPGLIACELLAALARVGSGGKAVCWFRDVDPERLDLIESAMTRGVRELPLYSVTLRHAAVPGTQGAALLEVLEAPYNPAAAKLQTSPARPEPARASRFPALIESDRLGVIVVDGYGFIQQINVCMGRLLGYGAEQLLDKPLRVVFPDISGDESFEGFRQVIEFRQRQNAEGLLEAVTADGQILQMDVSVFDHGVEPDGLTLLCRDASRNEQTKAALLHHRELLSAIYSQVADAILLVNRRGYVEHINPVGLEMLGLSDGAERQVHLDAILPLRSAGEKPLAPFQEMLNRQRTVSFGDQLLLLTPGREALPVTLTAVPLRDRVNRIAGGVMVMRAVSESRRVSTRLSWQATHDPLTQLPNRRQIENDLLRAIDAAHLNDSSHMLLYLDLYNFSVVNDTCGMAAGDELLRQFASLISRSVGNNDVVARIGNDEFAILLWERTAEAAREDAERILWQIKQYSFPWGERRLKVGASIGTKMIDRQTVSEIDVLVSAGASCAAAREAGRNRIHFQYQAQELSQRKSMATWTARISEALEQDRFAVHCQPIVPVRGGETIKHFEALVRMVDPDGNIVPPGKFIPAAESSGLIDDIDRWVLNRILLTLEGLDADRRAGLRFSVNLSGTTVGDERFREYLLERLRNSSVDAGQLQFEITETAAIRHFDRAVGFINAFRELGCYFSLDDFGSGLSSFGYLKALPVDYLKIDGGFIRNMELSDVDYSMVSTINHLAHVMGIATIAECVENQTQLSMLEEMGIDYAQGYHLAPPMSLDAILGK